MKNKRLRRVQGERPTKTYGARVRRSQPTQVRLANLRRMSNGNDRQMTSTTMIVNTNGEGIARVATYGGVRSGAFHLRRPLRSRFDTWLFVGRFAIETDLVRRLAGEFRVRPVFIKPSEPSIQLLTETVDVERHDDSSRAFVLQRQDGPFDHCNATILPNGSESLLDIVQRVFTPVGERTAGELRALVGDEMFWFHAGRLDQVSEPLLHVFGSRFLRKDADSHHASRIVIHGDGHPPAKRPGLVQRKRMPWSGQSVSGRHGRQIRVPDVVRSLGRHNATGRLGIGLRHGLFLEDPAPRSKWSSEPTGIAWRSFSATSHEPSGSCLAKAARILHNSG